MPNNKTDLAVEKMEIRETTVDRGAELDVHPIGGRIYLLPPSVIRHLYGGNEATFYVSARRNLEPLVIGIMAMNAIVAKMTQQAYPQTLVDPLLWRPSYQNIVRTLVMKGANGIEDSLIACNPANWVYLRASTHKAEGPTLNIVFEPQKASATLHGVIS